MGTAAQPAADATGQLRLLDLAPQPAKGDPMTTATDLSGTWSVDAFYRAHLGRDHRDPRRVDTPYLECCVRCVPALTARGVLPPGWPGAVACRLIRRMLDVQSWRDTPHDRDTLVTDASGRIVYHDGWDDLRAWMEDLGGEESEADPPGSLMPLTCDPSIRDTLLDRIGPDRMAAFVARLREAGPDPDHEWGWTAGDPDTRWAEIESHLRIAAELGRAAGRKWDHAALLDQAHRDAAHADRAAARRSASGPSRPHAGDRRPIRAPTPNHWGGVPREMLKSGEWVFAGWQPSRRAPTHGRRIVVMRRLGGR
jgi:hypothetical protein